MASNVISPVPATQPLVDKNGMPTVLFVGFLTDLWNRSGGANAPSNTQLSAALAAVSQTTANTIVGNNTGSVTNAIDLTPAQVAAMLPTFTPLLAGQAPASGGGTTNFLRADQTWAAPSTPVILDYFSSSKVSTSSSAITSGTFTTASNSPAFTFIPNFSGKYKVYCSIPMSVSHTTSASAATRVVNTSGGATLLSESQGLLTAPTAIVSVESSAFAQSVYTLTSGSSYVFDIQAKIISGTSVLIDGTNANFYMFAERVS